MAKAKGIYRRGNVHSGGGGDTKPPLKEKYAKNVLGPLKSRPAEKRI